MLCPFCGHEDLRVIDTRNILGGGGIRRRRECLNPACGERFTSVETVESDKLTVLKKNLSHEPFDRTKIIRGMARALEKRPVSTEDTENAAMQIEQKFRRSGRREIPVSDIGEAVLEALYDLDQVGYVRFASVYREFKDLGEFMRELKTLVQLQQART